MPLLAIVVSEGQRDESKIMHTLMGILFTKRRCSQSSTAIDDNAMFPETTFSLWGTSPSNRMRGLGDKFKWKKGSR